MNEMVALGSTGKLFPIDARDLHVRLEAGRDFSTWIKERVERFGFVANIDYGVFTGSGENPLGGRPSTEYGLSLQSAKMIAAIENSDTGRATLRYLVKVESAWNTPELAMARGLQAAQEIIERQKAEMALLADDAKAARVIACADGLKTFAEVGKINGIGPRKIIELLIDRKILFRRGRSILPFQQHIEAGRFVVREKAVDIGGVDQLYSQTYVTGKGEVWIAAHLFDEKKEA